VCGFSCILCIMLSPSVVPWACARMGAFHGSIPCARISSGSRGSQAAPVHVHVPLDCSPAWGRAKRHAGARVDQHHRFGDTVTDWHRRSEGRRERLYPTCRICETQQPPGARPRPPRYLWRVRGSVFRRRRAADQGRCVCMCVEAGRQLQHGLAPAETHGRRVAPLPVSAVQRAVVFQRRVGGKCGAALATDPERAWAPRCRPRGLAAPFVDRLRLHRRDAMCVHGPARGLLDMRPRPLSVHVHACAPRVRSFHIYHHAAARLAPAIRSAPQQAGHCTLVVVARPSECHRGCICKHTWRALIPCRHKATQGGRFQVNVGGAKHQHQRREASCLPASAAALETSNLNCAQRARRPQHQQSAFTSGISQPPGPWDAAGPVARHNTAAAIAARPSSDGAGAAELSKHACLGPPRARAATSTAMGTASARIPPGSQAAVARDEQPGALRCAIQALQCHLTATSSKAPVPAPSPRTP
jgi:hypothetical protein